MKFLWLGVLFASSAAAKTLGGDVTGPSTNNQVQKITGFTAALPTCSAGEYINLVGSGLPPSGPYWCNPSNAWVQIPILDTSYNLTINNPSNPGAGSITLFSQSGQSLSITVPTGLSQSSSLSLPVPGTTGAPTSIQDQPHSQIAMAPLRSL